MSERADASDTAIGGDADYPEAHQQFRTVANTIDEGVCQFDLEGRIVAVNDPIVEMTGYPSEELLGEHVSMVLDDWSPLERELERLRTDAGERGDLLELAVQTADGGRAICEARMSPLEADGTVQGSIGIVRDVSERARTERRAAFLDQLGQTLQPLTDPDEIVATAGRLLGEQLNVDRFAYADVTDDENHVRVTDDAPGDAESFVGKQGLADVPDELLESMRENHPFVVDDVDADERDAGADEGTHEQTGIQSVVCVPLCDDGTLTGVMEAQHETPREWQSHEVDLVTTTVQRCQNSLRRARTMRELREREQHLSALVETTPECIKTVADDGTLLQMNPAGLDMVEADSATDVVGENVYDLIAPEHLGKFKAFNERICGGDRETLQFDIVGLNGTRRHMESHAAPLRSPDGSVSHVALTRDITEQVERERRLQETVQKLEASNDRLEQFAYAASHDLQEPLRMVSTYLQMIQRRYTGNLDEEGQEFIDYAVDGADRMRNMIEGLLEYSRVDTHGDSFEPVDLDAVLTDVRADLQMRIGESDAEIASESLPRVDGDEEQLRQVFQNLLDNAIEYSGEDSPQVDISAERDGGAWIVSVSDDGIGIGLDEPDRVFDVFQSLHAPDQHAGTGIGLAICERIVERHGGDVWVESDAGEGATFSFTLPAASDTGA